MSVPALAGLGSAATNVSLVVATNRADWLRLHEKIVRIRRDHHLDDLIAIVESNEQSGSSRSDDHTILNGTKSFDTFRTPTSPTPVAGSFEGSHSCTPQLPPHPAHHRGILSPTLRLDINAGQLTKSMADGLRALLAALDEMFLDTSSSAVNSRQTSAGSSRFRSTNAAFNEAESDGSESIAPSLQYFPHAQARIVIPHQTYHLQLVQQERSPPITRAAPPTQVTLEGSSTMTNTVGETTQGSFPDGVLSSLDASALGDHHHHREASSAIIGEAHLLLRDEHEHTVAYRNESQHFLEQLQRLSPTPLNEDHQEKHLADMAASQQIVPVGRRRKSEGLYLQDSNSVAGSRSASREPMEATPVSLLQQRQGSCTSLWRRSSANSIASLPISQRCQFQQTSSLVLHRDDTGVKWINHYAVIGLLGRGSQGKVKLAEHRDGFSHSTKLVAIKVLPRSPKAKWWRAAELSALRRIETEIEIMKKLKHKNVVQLYEVIDDPSSQKMYLVMQYIAQGPICKLERDMTCPCFPEDRVASVVRQMITGLRYLHRHGVVHRDIKPENILLGEHGRIYLADFGVAEMFERGDNPIVAGRVGTPMFFAPEMFDPIQSMDAAHRPNNNNAPGGISSDVSVAVVGLAAAVDVWALGVTMYCLLFGRPPFGHQSSTLSLEDDVCFSDLTFPSSRGVSAEARDFLCRVLEKNPEERVTLGELRKHRWLEVFAPPTKAPAATISGPNSRRTSAAPLTHLSLPHRGSVTSNRQPSPIPRADDDFLARTDDFGGVIPSPPRRPLSETHRASLAGRRPSHAWALSDKEVAITDDNNKHHSDENISSPNISRDSCSSPPNELRSTLPCLASSQNLGTMGASSVCAPSSVSATSGTDPHFDSKRNSMCSLLSVESNVAVVTNNDPGISNHSLLTPTFSSRRLLRKKLNSMRNRSTAFASGDIITRIGRRLRIAVFVIIFARHVSRCSHRAGSLTSYLPQIPQPRTVPPPVSSPRKVALLSPCVADLRVGNPSLMSEAPLG
ncbi:protein kinase, putative [Bodo saltans]|uniref:Protein kinase, putative n=1 Tax=Bodo saltans TaxID=75058 RepID=A0A0S4JEC5_BODSA|nr:protein kinase, putative [Bodo saltans]|eukprot:CUG86721.1 protein kinase, putative [Bodo saltans]